MEPRGSIEVDSTTEVCPGVIYRDVVCGRKIFCSGLCRGCFFRKLERLIENEQTNRRNADLAEAEIADLTLALKTATGLNDEQLAQLLKP